MNKNKKINKVRKKYAKFQGAKSQSKIDGEANLNQFETQIIMNK